MNKKSLYYLNILLFVIIIFSPLLLGELSNFFNINFETKLYGFTNTVNKPDIKFSSFINGSLRKEADVYLNENISLRSYFIKIYNTLRYELFKLGKLAIGKNDYLYERTYLMSYYALNDKDDYSKTDNQKAIKEYVNDLVKLQEKLKIKGKNLYVLIAPSKARLYANQTPDKYKEIAKKDRIDPLEYFKGETNKTNLNIFFAQEIAKNTKYPTFYKTGIHWSRIYEQSVENKIIDDLNNLTKKSYRKFVLGKIRKSKHCYWRDCDIYNLSNIWPREKGEYYRYEMKRETPLKFDKMRFLIQGGSFINGFINDINENYPDEEIYRLSRDDFFIDSDNKFYNIQKDYSNVNLERILNNIDVVIIETVESEISYYSYGLVKHLLSILDKEENKDKIKDIDNITFPQNKIFNNINLKHSIGLHNPENTYIWIKDYAMFLFDSKKINNDIEINFSVPREIIKQDKHQNVTIYLNKEKIFEEDFNEAGKKKVIISKNKVLNEEKQFEILINSSSFFIPKEVLRNSKDTRELALKINYIGAKR